METIIVVALKDGKFLCKGVKWNDLGDLHKTVSSMWRGAEILIKPATDEENLQWVGTGEPLGSSKHVAILPKSKVYSIKHRAGLYQIETDTFGTVFLEGLSDGWEATDESGNWIASARTMRELEGKVFNLGR